MSDSFTLLAPEQPAAIGSGPLLERRYSIDVVRFRLSLIQLMSEGQAYLLSFSSGLLADSERKAGQDGSLKTGDEFRIKIFVLLNGIVRVTEVGTIFSSS